MEITINRASPYSGKNGIGQKCYKPGYVAVEFNPRPMVIYLSPTVARLL